ncbi:MAG: phage tail protein [Akkermansia sp.]|nr:phage tail protein [Akkermansia sp.]
MVITTAGLELLQDLILEGGTPLTFSGVGVGDGLLEDGDITTQTSLVHEIHRLPIEKIEKQEGGHIRVFARLATDIITTDFCHRELGVFAKHGEQEILFAYGNAGDDYDFVPATGNNASICKTIVTEFTVGSMKAVFLPLDSSDLVTHSSLNERIEQIKSGDNTWDGKQTFEGAVMCADGLSIPGGKKITLSNGGAIIHANENNSTVHVSSLASSGGVSGNVVNCNRVNSAALAITGTSTFSAGVTMAQSLNVSGNATFEGLVSMQRVSELHVSDGLNNFFNVHLDSGGVNLERSNVDPAYTLYDGDTTIYNRHDNDARYGRIGTSNTWNGNQTINGAFSVGSGKDLNLYIHASGGISASLFIAEMRIYRGNNDGNFYVDTGIGNTLFFDRGVYFYDAVNFASGVTMSQSLNVVGGLTATDETTTLGNVITANISVQRVNVQGPASFDYGVTMAQSLMVEGRTIIKTGLNVGEDLCLYGSDGLPGGSLLGYYESPDESTIIIKDAGAMEYMGISYNSNISQASLNLRGNAAYLALPENLVGPAKFYTPEHDYILFGINYDHATGYSVGTDFPFFAYGGMDVASGVVFHSGVTMDQSLNLSGKATLNNGCDIGPSNQLKIYASGPTGYISSTYGELVFRSDTDAYSVYFRGMTSAATVDIIKPHATALNDESILNRAEGDARWVKFNNTLTAAQYAALAVKDQTTIYITSDTGEIYLGSYALN